MNEIGHSADTNPIHGWVENPLYDVLVAITGANPPDFVKKHYTTNDLTDDEDTKLQEWCVSNSRPFWSSGIGIMEAANTIVEEAIGCALIGSSAIR